MVLQCVVLLTKFSAESRATFRKRRLTLWMGRTSLSLLCDATATSMLVRHAFEMKDFSRKFLEGLDSRLQEATSRFLVVQVESFLFWFRSSSKESSEKRRSSKSSNFTAMIQISQSLVASGFRLFTNYQSRRRQVLKSQSSCSWHSAPHQDLSSPALVVRKQPKSRND